MRGNGGTSDSFYVSVDDGAWKALHHHSWSWKWSPVLSFHLAKAGKHTLKVILREDGARVSHVKLLPPKISGDNYPVWFAQIDGDDAFTTGLLSDEKTGKCMVRPEQVVVTHTHAHAQHTHNTRTTHTRARFSLKTPLTFLSKCVFADRATTTAK